MTLSLALNNALSGLRVTSQQAEVASNNVSNALTPGYARRTAVIGENIAGGASSGATVIGIERATATRALDSKRMADGDAGFANTLADATTRIADAIGGPGDASSLATEAAELANRLSLAAETPESRAFLDQAVRASGDFVSAINRIAVEVQSVRIGADASIRSQVDQINSSLVKIQSLNSEIQDRALKGQDTSALEDQRARLLDDVSTQIPIRVVPRENETVAIYAKNGGQLLDGRLATIEFTETNAFGPGQTIGNGGLSPLIVDGREISIGAENGGGLYDGGSLAAAFQLRDEILPAIGADLDALAEDAILRTQGLAADPTITPADAGLFTDDGGAYDPADRIGIALRLTLNPAVDTSNGGESFRLRDGLLAASIGETGTSETLRGLLDNLEIATNAPAGSSLTGSRSLIGFAEEFSSITLISAANRTENAAFESGKATTFSDIVASEVGVDSDEELSRLLVIERAYAANARVINVVDEMLERLLSI